MILLGGLKVMRRLSGGARYSRPHRQVFEVAISTVLNSGQRWDFVNALADLKWQ